MMTDKNTEKYTCQHCWWKPYTGQ